MRWRCFNPVFESEEMIHDLESPWGGHRYFAYDLISNLHPKIIVELGTYRGTSFFAFCQAVKDHKLDCQLYAVDSWTGDPHATFYSEDVFQLFNDTKTKHYSGLNINLLRMNFDEAVIKFPDHSIDILHIDGYHTYEAVSNDFTRWYNKVSENGIILLHDTHERKDDFGVYNFWDEIKATHGTFEFYHSHGLGVLVKISSPLKNALHYQDIWQQYYSLQDTFRKSEHLRNQEIITFNKAISDLGLEKTNLNQMIQEKEAQILGKDHILKENEIALHEKDRIIQKKEDLIRENEIIIHGNDSVTQKKEDLIREKEEIIKALTSSFAWKVTYPFRKIMSLFHFSQGKFGNPHFAPPTDDYSLLVPFNYKTEIVQPSPGIAVICHMFYTDLIEEFKSYLLNIPYAFDLFITTDTIEKKQVIENAFNKWNQGNVVIWIAPNRGRDIAPKLLTCRDIYDQYEFVLTIHTKKSLQEKSLIGWRIYLLESLLGSNEIVKSIIDAFNCDQKLGIIAPQHYANTRHAIGWGWNFKIAKAFAKRMGVKISLKWRIDFPSGSMFWARSSAIKPLLDSGISISDFPEETGQLDETISHVIERLFFLSCEKAGYRWIKIINPEVYSNAERMIEVNSQSKLLDTIKNVQKPILGTVRHQHNLSGLNGQLLKKIVRLTGIPKFNNALYDLIANKIIKHISKKTFYRKVHQNSVYSALHIDEFIKQMTLHIDKKESKIDFDEEFYLKANKDVAQMISMGVYDCGYIHFCLHGRQENRLWSNHQIKQRFGTTPNYPEGMFAPVNIKLTPHYAPLFRDLPGNKDPFLLILVAHLQSNLFYAGYNEFFRDFLPVFNHFSRVVLAVENETFEPGLATSYSRKIEVIHQNRLSDLKYRPDVVICFSNQLFMKAGQLFNSYNRLVYYCQEYEAGFFPYSTAFIEAVKAIVNSKHIIFSTGLLRNFLIKKNLLTDQRVFTTSPVIECFEVKPEKTKRLFFYFRPEFFHSRNIPEILWDCVHEFCNKNSGYEIYMVGTIDTRFSFEINSNPVYVMNKLPQEDYIDLISSCDVVIAMIYSAHPGVVAFQAAASGIPTITNVFEKRDALLLKQISDNIVPYDPIRERLLTKLEEALAMPKGIKSFNETLYSGEKETITLSEFIAGIGK